MNIQISKLLKLTCVAVMLCSLAGCSSFGKKKNSDQQYTGTDADSVNGTPLPDRQEGVSFTSDNVDKTKFRPVHFAFDSFAIDNSEQSILDEVAGFLKNGSNSIIIAGFTDERGTAEYNRGLGEKRAEAVRQYLIQRGADGGKIQTVSFGAEMPVDPSSNEGAWAKNRRAEFGVVK
jgi:peptidoglycan-associated lipoprotein